MRGALGTKPPGGCPVGTWFVGAGHSKANRRLSKAQHRLDGEQQVNFGGEVGKRKLAQKSEHDSLVKTIRITELIDEFFLSIV